MTESKYGKYIVTEPDTYKLGFAAAKPGEDVGRLPTLSYMDNDLVPGSNMHIAYLRGVRTPTTRNQIEYHSHPFDEVLLFFGTDLHNPTDLGGEVELVFGEEREVHKVTKSCAVFIPAGLEHTVTFTRVDRPNIGFSISLTGHYPKAED